MSLSGGAIAGIVVGIICVIALGVALIFYFKRRNKKLAKQHEEIDNLNKIENMYNITPEPEPEPELQGGDIDIDEYIESNIAQYRLNEYELIRGGGVPKDLLNNPAFITLKEYIIGSVKPIIEKLLPLEELKALSDLMLQEYTTDKGTKTTRALAFDTILNTEAMQTIMTIIRNSDDIQTLINSLCSNISKFYKENLTPLALGTRLGALTLKIKDFISKLTTPGSCFQAIFVTCTIKELLSDLGNNATLRCKALAKWFKDAPQEEITAIKALMALPSNAADILSGTLSLVTSKSNSQLANKTISKLNSLSEKFSTFNYETFWKELIPTLLSFFVREGAKKEEPILDEYLIYIGNVCDLIFNKSTVVNGVTYTCNNAKELVIIIQKICPEFEKKVERLNNVIAKLWPKDNADDLNDMFDGDSLDF